MSVNQTISNCLPSIKKVVIVPFNPEALKKAEEYERNLSEFHPDLSTNEPEIETFKIYISTIDNVPGKKTIEYKGVVYASVSEVAAFEKQQSRLMRSTHGVLKSLEAQALILGANAVVGISIAANNSTGTAWSGGSSDSLTAIGTAVVVG